MAGWSLVTAIHLLPTVTFIMTVVCSSHQLRLQPGGRCSGVEHIGPRDQLTVGGVLE